MAGGSLGAETSQRSCCHGRSLTPVPSDNRRPVDDDLAALGRHWGLFVVSGCIGLVVGILVLAYPDVSLKLLGVFLGIDLLLVGVLVLIRGVSGDGETAGGPGRSCSARSGSSPGPR